MADQLFIDTLYVDNFAVVNRDTEELVGGLDSTSFEVSIYDSQGRSRVLDGDATAIDYTIAEIGTNTGVYKFEFTPDLVGTWVVLITNATYFPWGKTANYLVVLSTHFSGSVSDDVDDLLAIVLGTS